MELSFILPNLETGGAERVVINLSSELSKRDHEVEIVVGDATGELLKEVPDDVQIVNIDSSNIPYLGVFNMVYPLIDYLKAKNPDIVYSAMNHVNIATIVAKQLSSSESAVVISEHNTPSQIANRFNAVQNKLLYKSAYYLYPLAQEIVAVSEGVADDLASFVDISREQIEVIYNPVVNDDIDTLSEIEMEDPWFEDDDISVVLTVGRLTHQKGFDILIESAKYLGEETKIVIVGEGPLKKELSNSINENDLSEKIRLTGYVDNPYQYMAHADVFALPSRWEGLPTVLIEAMACGCDVVATDCPSGPKEILDSGRFGELVPVEEPMALAEAIRSSLQDEDDKESVQKWVNQFRGSNVTDRYEDLFTSIVTE